jgi:thiol:disulfide interchange protein
MYKYNLFSLLFLCVTALPLAAQQASHPLKWSFDSKDLGNGQFELIMKADIKDGWTTYSQFLESEDGPVATQLVFQDGPHFRRVGKAEESGEKYTTYDKVFGMNLTKFKHQAIFKQKIEVKDPSKPITGYITSMCCDDGQCLPPTDTDFSITVKPTAPIQGTPAPGTPETKQGQGSVVPPVDNSGAGNIVSTQPTDNQTGAVAPTAQNNTTPIAGQAPVTINEGDTNMRGAFDSRRDINASAYINKCDDGATQQDGSLWMIFLWGMLFGFAAVLTPCIFPMIPVTVGFFVKRTKDRATGLRNALWYGLSIVLIYLAIGIGLTSAFGPTVLNEMSTNMWFNLVFFAVFFIFALSFFGFFEITLPNSWINASDRMADKGGALGIFFMAFTLALVSFSCTGPLVGSLLVETASSNQGDQILGFIPARPFAGLLGFGLALALPFALFAMFPGWLKSLPKSGGWMDNVKITLGFVELALAFKFLSTADMVQHWDVLKFELFLAIWILCAALLGLYQLGILNWKGAQGRPGVVRLGLAALSLAFAGYMTYGLIQYRPMGLLSGIAPPVHYNFFRPMDCPHGLDCYHDFDEALAVAKLENKPLFVDFTGYGCVNCRKMEETVWTDPEVIRRLRENYVVVSLYVDDRERLFPDNKFAYLQDAHTGQKIRTVGDKWSSFQINNFQRNSQPWYVLMDNDGTSLLNEPRGYTPDKDIYRDFLDCGYNAFERQKDNKSRQMLSEK